jgi:uncharacterized membrane protein
MAVYPAMKTFEPKITAQIHRAIDLLPDAYMRPSTITSGLSALLILILHHDLTAFITTFTVIGLIGTLGIVFTSEFFNVRINRVVHSWKDDYVAPEYPQMLARWGRFHVVRTSSSVLALVCYIISGLAH